MADYITDTVMPFISGGTSNMSLEELRRRQAVAAATAAQKRAYPKTLGEGIAALGEGIGDRMENDRLREVEARYAGQKYAPYAAPAAAGGASPGATRVPTERIAPDAMPTTPLPGRDRLAALLDPDLMSKAPQEVASLDPTLGAETPLGSQSDDPVWSARQHAIGGIESDQDYGAVGVPTKYGRAIGRYGVMEVNVPKWTAEALGQPMTPQQFLKNSDAQDAVFKHRFGQYIAKYGEEKAARAWYGGEGNINNLDATDAHEKLSVKDYGQDYVNRLIKAQRRSDVEGDAAAPVQLAALGGPSGTMTDAPPIGMGGGSPGGGQMVLPPGGASDTPAGFGTPAPLGGGSAPNYVPSPRPPPPSIRPSIEPEPDPTVVDSIKPMSVVPNQFAQVGPEMFSPRPMMSDASAALPAGRPPGAAPVATAGPPGVRPEVAIPPAPTPLKFPSPGREPQRQGETPEMNYYRNLATDRNVREDLRAQYGERYKQLATQQESDYVRKWTDWRNDVDKERAYNLADPVTRQQLVHGHLANIKTRQELEGEGFFPLSAEQAARLYPGSTPPEGQALWLNRRGEPKFGPAAPKTTVNIDQKAEGKGLEELQKKMAGHMVEQFEAGNSAADDLKTLAQMRVLAAKVNTGPEAVVKQFAGRWGIKTEGISNIEALNAVINRVVPTQRVPGSGTTSDFDARMFAASVPHLMNTPDGNALIMDTMEGAARNKMARAEVAGKVISGQLTIAQGTGELLKLQGEAKALSDRVAAHLETKGVKTETVLPSESTMKGDALEWIKNNPDDPRTPEIRRRLGL